MDDSVDPNRRAFFRQAAQGFGKAAVQSAETAVTLQAARWIRPPFALDELQFLLTCTRCDDCVKACPHGTIFKLGPRLGARVVGTPALDLNSKACHLCEDWPCVTACEPKALKLPEPAEEPEEAAAVAPAPLRPRLAQVTIDTATCLPFSGPECGACEPVCPVPGAIKMVLARPQINAELCTGCALCRVACITEPKAIKISSVHAGERLRETA